MTTVEDGLVVKNHTSNRVHYLNHTAGFVLMLCDGKKPIHKIASLVRSQFELEESPKEEISDIVEQFLKEKLVKMKNK